MAGETGVFGENIPHFGSSHHKPHITCSGLEPGPPRWEAGDSPPDLRHGITNVL
jgi:hypothetical protein